jgi:MFS family permease
MVKFIINRGPLSVMGAAVWQNWALMLTGRAVFGIGAESLYITQTAILASWFDESSMSFALSVLLVATRMSSVANSLVAPAVASANTAVDIGCAVCGVAWVASVFLALYHASFER